MRIINTSEEMLSSFENGRFDIEKWNKYIDKTLPGSRKTCIDDMQECVNSGYSWQKDFLPVLNNVFQDEEARNSAVREFTDIADGLEERIISFFHKTVDVDIVLYLGLCNGAGWATEINGRHAILLGIEKIIELGWYEKEKLTALIFHEIGHVYHKQYGLWNDKSTTLPEQFLWKLFSEGVAMVFEQDLVGNPDFYQQDIKGWKDWCDKNFVFIRDSFIKDLYSMDHNNQMYFGDWVSFNGYGDTGYYLGTRFVRNLLLDDKFDNLILYDISRIKDGFDRFAQL